MADRAGALEEGRHLGREGEEIEAARLRREGWTLSGAERRRKSGRAVLACEVLGIDRERYWLELADDAMDLGATDWADWDHQGDLLLARDGRLWRLDRRSLRDPDRAREVADLRALRFEARVSPPAARAW